MHLRNSVLCNELNRYQKIIIYGTGYFAQKIYPQLIKFNLRKKIVCFTQTEECGLVSIDGIPIINIKKINYNKEECVVLVAVSVLYANEIKRTLLEFEYPHIVSLIDYRVHYQWLETDYRDLTSFEEYYEYIEDWHIRTQKCNKDGRAILQRGWDGKKSTRRKTDDNLVVWICGHLSSRTTKIIGALIRKGYRIVFLSYFDGANPWNLDELQQFNIQIYQCLYIAELLYWALQYNPLVYFFEPFWGNCLWAEIMLKYKKHFGKVVLALYDVMNDGYTGKTEEELATEKYALEHADGIVWRWFSKEYLEEKGFRYQGKSIQFLDYCYHKNEENVSYDLNPFAIKICFLSGYGDEYVEDRAYVTRYTDWARIGEILEKIGNRTDCEFHFYAGALQNNANMERCEQYVKKYNNFKFFLGTEHKELLKRLKEYDYGCELWTGGETPPDDMPMGNYYGSIFNNSVRNAYFDFLSAGVPVITTQASRMREFLGAEEAIIQMTLSDLDIDYLIEHKQYYKEKVEEKRKEWDIDNQIPKLIRFFQEINFVLEEKTGIEERVLTE